MLNDYWMQLKQIGTQLQNMGLEIQKMGMVNIMNQNQFQAIGMQISNMGLQIFNYGIQMSNLILNMQEINMNMNMQMPAFINQMQMMPQMNQPKNNYSNNEDQCICNDPNYMKIFFDYYGNKKFYYILL